ncbi:hypothetical protein ACNQO6_18220 [Acinetobacter calcoaceticus]|uniref:hypothetical protein n=1 Tax=Acinetobacter calcoaceticus TaxID=471 RepID=UPI003F7B627A
MAAAALPATKLNDVVAYLGVPAFKNLNPFSVAGKKKAELKQAMNALLSKNPAAAYTGLGIIYNYENQIELACNAFYNAYRASNHDLLTSRHLANQEYLFKDRAYALSLFKTLIKDNPLDLDLAIEFSTRALTLLYLDDYIEVLEHHKCKKDIQGLMSEIFIEATEIQKFVLKNKINIEAYRDIVGSADKVFSYYFTVPTETGVFKYIDTERNTITISYELPALEGLPESLLGDINDRLQDELVLINKKYKINSSSPEDKIILYFEPTEVQEAC